MNPLIPPNKKDPAGQLGNVKDGFAQLNKRYKKIKKQIFDYIELQNKQAIRIETNALTINAVTYDYQVDAKKIRDINTYILAVLNENLLDNIAGNYSDFWWLNFNLETAYDDGLSDTLQSAKNVSVESAVGYETFNQVQMLSVENTKISPQYQARIGMVYARVFELMKGLTDSSKSDLSDTLARGMIAGKGVNQLKSEVGARIDVSQSRAKRIVRTEILNAYRTSTNEETKGINESIYKDSEWHMMPLWWSALSATTRHNHAVRHGHTYTEKQVQDFYDTGANAINCLCSQSVVLVNKKTGEPFQQNLIDKMAKQRESYLEG